MSEMIVTARRYDEPDLRAHVEAYHYLHRWPDARSLPFGYAMSINGEIHRQDGRLNGLVVFKKPQHHRQRGLFGYAGLPTEWQVLDLARVWIHPELQQTLFLTVKARFYSDLHIGKVEIGELKRFNFFSRFVSQAIHRVQHDWLDFHPPVYPDLPYHITVILSYCELKHHDGTAYRASGFQRCGHTADGQKELYVRWLKAPLKSWSPSRPAQLPLLAGMPLVHKR